MARSVNTNPVVIRRMLGLLREAGLVTVQRGSRAGWKLARDPAAINVLQVHQAVEPDPPFGFHHTPPNQACPVGRGIQPALKHVYGKVERSLKRDLEATSIADVLKETLSWIGVLLWPVV